VPRDLPIGNGSLLVAFDRDYQLRDIYFPRVGEENQTEGYTCRFGVWCEGKFSWIGSEWSHDMRYEPDTLVTKVRLENAELALVLEVSDAVDFHINALVRRIKVVNPEPRDREVRLFFHQDFHIYGSDIGDSCYYDPDSRGIAHYKGRRWFLACGSAGEMVGATQWACGQKESNGGAGTHKDAEDGLLSGNPVAQGAVDSVLGLTLTIPAGSDEVAYYWLAAAEDLDGVSRVHRAILEKGPAEILGRTTNFWKLWSRSEDLDLAETMPEAIPLFRRSLLILRTQIDNGGAIVAANDSDITLLAHDTYSYMWPRDGALVCQALARSGLSYAARRFFYFCNEVVSPDGYLMQKYNPDGSVASSWHSWFRDGRKRLPIQEDETALVIWALHQFFDRYRDVEFIRPFYRHLIIAGAEFMYRYRDEETLLPLASHDLWEERYGVHTWTVASVIAGFKAAAAFAAEFGERKAAKKYEEAASNMADAMRKYLFSEEHNRFARMGKRTDTGYRLDMTIDSSLAGLFRFAFSADDPQVVSTMEQVRDRLQVRTDVGGWARYENDYYQQVEKTDLDRVPGNPWFVCSLWIAEWLIARARGEEDLAEARKILELVARQALPSGVMAEQLHPYTGEPLSVSPLSWSHAAFVNCVLDYAARARRLSHCRACGQPLTVAVPERPVSA
jgi:GH15 family glucan-1,4-alpha-glucosidase